MKAQYLECSSFMNEGVDEIFQQAIKTMVACDPRNMTESQNAVQGDFVGMGKKKKKRSCKML
jgi:hypothetical protein